jgi:hypothetical protein
MNGKWLGIFGLMAVAAALCSMSSCAHSQQLVSIQVQPSVETIGASDTPVIDNAGAQVQLRALGTYIHPPVTKDITNEVTWASNTPQMFTVTTAGLLTATGESCGGTLVSATVTTNSSAGGLSSSGALVTGYMTANVVCFTGGGTGSGPAITVTFGGTGAGIVTSNPSGLSCSSPNPCVDQFPVGTNIMLTATATGSTFGGWQNCPVSTTTNVCSFTLETNTTVTATFN